MNQMEIFKNPEFGAIRAVEIDGEPWLVGKDVSLALGYTNPQKAIRDHVDAEDRTVNDSFTVNGTAITLINESGLYSLVLSSKLPKAKQFRRWVTSEVLPTIRKHGAYMTREKLWEVATSPEALLKTGIKTKGMSGKPIATEAPYGYMKDPDNKDFWIIDEEAAEVVRLIFRLFIGGKNRNQIAVYLTQEQIPTPTFYMKDRGRGTCKNKALNEDNRYKWNKVTLTHILTRQEYCGDVVNFKTTKHFRDKRNHYVDRSQWQITENVHEPIIDRADFETAQRILENAPVRRPNGDGEIHPLSGLLFCKDCGAKMHIRIDYRNGGKSYEKHEKDANRFIALIDKYENFDKLTIAMLNEFIEKILVHERDRKGSIQTTQEVEIYFNFVGRFVPPAFGEAELTPEELEEIRKREERKDRLHQNYLKRKASGAQKRYEDKIKGRKKAEIEAKKAAIRAEDIAKGVFVPVSSLPQREPMKGVQTA